MTNLFICKRTLGGSEEGTRYYQYEELAPVEDLERVRELIKKGAAIECGPCCNWEFFKEALEILEKMKL